MKVCQFCGRSEKEVRVIKTKRFGEEMVLCDAHYYQMVRTGKLRHKRTDPNEYVEHEDYIEMFLYDKLGNKIASTYFSKEHKEVVLQYRWSLKKYPNRNTDYVVTEVVTEEGKRKKIRLHNLIAERLFGERPKGYTVDHINKNGLDNRNENLRYANQSEQNFNQKIRRDNTSGVRGVSYYKKINKWIAQIKCGEIRLKKLFDTFEEAVEQRKLWEQLRNKGELK